MFKFCDPGVLVYKRPADVKSIRKVSRFGSKKKDSMAELCIGLLGSYVFIHIKCLPCGNITTTLTGRFLTNRINAISPLTTLSNGI